MIVVIGDEFLNHIVPESLTLPFPLRAVSQVLRQRSKLVMYSLEWATFTDVALASINLSVCTPWSHRDPVGFFNFAGGPSMYCARWSNEAATLHADITTDHRHCDVRNHDPILESWRLFQDEEVLLPSRANARFVVPVGTRPLF